MLIQVTESSQAGEARRRAVAIAEDLNMSEEVRGVIALVTTELATNLVKHAKSGHILLQQIRENSKTGVRIISVDKGPGIREITKALSDGHSTAGTLGAGFGAVCRAASRFHIYSVADMGTVLVAEFWSSKGTSSLSGEAQFEIGAVSEPLAGEDVCGDAWSIRRLGGNVLAMVADGLGHGLLAAEAAREAERAFCATRRESLPEMLSDLHDALKKTRGAAVGLARVDFNRSLLSFAGVGNITTSIVSPGLSRSMASHNGTLGQNMDRVQEFSVPWNPDSLLVMHSDGLTRKWDLDQYPGVWGKHPSLVAALLHRDFSRERDDATVLVLRGTAVNSD